MQKHTIPQLLRLLGIPALTVALGAVLLLNPDTVSALGGKLLGWVFLLAAVMDLFSQPSGEKKYRVRTILTLLLGLWLLMNPLVLAKGIGRVLGLAFFIWGIGKFRGNPDRRSPRSLAGGAVALLGLALFLLPMSTSRLVLRVIGIVTICLGIADGFDRLRGRKLLDQGNDPKIIDVEKL